MTRWTRTTQWEPSLLSGNDREREREREREKERQREREREREKERERQRERKREGERESVLACLRACVLSCVRACVRACMRACVRACVRAWSSLGRGTGGPRSIQTEVDVVFASVLSHCSARECLQVKRMMCVWCVCACTHTRLRGNGCAFTHTCVFVRANVSSRVRHSCVSTQLCIYARRVPALHAFRRVWHAHALALMRVRVCARVRVGACTCGPSHVRMYFSFVRQCLSHTHGCVHEKWHVLRVRIHTRLCTRRDACGRAHTQVRVHICVYVHVLVY